MGCYEADIGKPKFKIKKLPHRIVIDEKEIIDEKTTAKKFNRFFKKFAPKLFSKIPSSNTHFEQHVKYEGPNLERKELRNEELKNPFYSLTSYRSPGYDGISSFVVESVSEEILSVLKQVLNLSINQVSSQRT